MTDYWHTTLHRAKAKPDPVAIVMTVLVIAFIVAAFFVGRHTG